MPADWTRASDFGLLATCRVFQYKALQANGAMAEGQLEAAGRQEAFAQMAGLGLRPVSLAEKAGRCGRNRLRAAGRAGFHLVRQEVEQGLRPRAGELHAAAFEPAGRGRAAEPGAGDPHKESSSPAASAKWKEIHDLVVDGMSLADAMGKSPETFPRVYTAMVQAGETGGFLDLVLAQIADFQAREKELRSKVMSAMLYPCILFVLAIGVLIFLLTFFIPRFQGIFKGFGATLPLADPDRDRGEPRGERLWGVRGGGFGDCRASCCGRGSRRKRAGAPGRD